MRRLPTRGGDIPVDVVPVRNEFSAGKGAWAGIIAALVLGFPAWDARAQDKAVSTSVVPGGGGVSTGSRFSVTGTVGQHDATVTQLVGSRFGIQGGFHALVAIQTPGAPELSISVSGGQVTVSWPAETTGWMLQESGVVGGGASWSSSVGVSNNRLILGLPNGNRFYRLQRSTQ